MRGESGKASRLMNEMCRHFLFVIFDLDSFLIFLVSSECDGITWAAIFLSKEEQRSDLILFSHQLACGVLGQRSHVRSNRNRIPLTNSPQFHRPVRPPFDKYNFCFRNNKLFGSRWGEKNSQFFVFNSQKVTLDCCHLEWNLPTAGRYTSTMYHIRTRVGEPYLAATQSSYATQLVGRERGESWDRNK